MGTITKALDLLTFFSTQRPEIGLGEFVRLAARDKATVHRYLTELAECGFLEQNSKSRGYRLGPAILRLYGVREATSPLRSVLRDPVSEMADEIGELVHVSILQGSQLSPVLHADPRQHGTQVAFDESVMLPLHATASGLAILSFGPQLLRERVLNGPLERFTAATLTEPDVLRARIAAFRERGIAWLEQGFDDEVASQAGPIFGPDGEVIGVVAIAVPTARASDEKCARMTEVLHKWIARMSKAVGGTLPASYQHKVTADD